jgi:hemoglobin
MAEAELNIHDHIGGQKTFDRLVDHFYDDVEKDPILRPLYPESLEESRKHLAMFLAQFVGGPPEYSMLRGHPRLRARHLPFAIGVKERYAWVKPMLEAVDATGIEEPSRTHLRNYFQEAATFLMNQKASAGPRRVAHPMHHVPEGGQFLRPHHAQPFVEDERGDCRHADGARPLYAFVDGLLVASFYEGLAQRRAVDADFFTRTHENIDVANVLEVFEIGFEEALVIGPRVFGILEGELGRFQGKL